MPRRRGLAATEDEVRTLRRLAWWRRNDAYRHLAPGEAVIGAAPTGRCRENLEALLPLLHGEDEGVVIKRAELMRELGHFDSARQALRGATSPACTSVVRQLVAMCDWVDVCVREVIHEDATCPECNKPLRASRARQCRFRGAGWHDRPVP